MGHTALVLGDQLSHANPVLDGADRVLMIESQAALSRLRYHRRRRHLVLSAMRHFAQELRDAGVDVDYVRADTMAPALRLHADVRVAAPNDAGARKRLADKGVTLVPSTQFLTDPDAFAGWADGRRNLKMEDFYRDQRRRFGVLMDGDEPEGGRWNFDADNRRPPKEGLSPRAPYRPREDDIDAEVRADLDAMDLPEWDPPTPDGPRELPATADEAKRMLRDFVEHRLAGFGTWQDAMVPGERWLFHSLLSTSLNLWLLDPLTTVRAVERAYRAGDAPLNAAEGFIRQVIGWREYVWGMYWLRADEWRTDNALNARRGLPAVFWTGETDLNCLGNAMTDVLESGYAHHILRLMVLGNLHLLLGVEPWESVEWFRAAFVDGAEWVMAPNAAGMATWADGGAMMTKPYAASGNYIDKMSRFCGDCRYTPRKRTGEDACPVTQLYWDWMARHGDRFEGNRRMQYQVAAVRKMDPGELEEIRRGAERHRRRLSAGAAG